MDKDQLQLRRQVGQLFDMIEETQKLAETTARAQDTRRTALMPGEAIQIMDADGNVAAYFGGSNASGQLIEHVAGPEPKRPSVPELDSPMPGVITVVADGRDENGEEAQGNHDRVLIHLSHEEGFTPSEATAQHSFFGPEGRQDVSAEPGEWYVAIQWRTKTGQLSEPSEQAFVEVLELVNSADIKATLEESRQRLADAMKDFEEGNETRKQEIQNINDVVLPALEQSLTDAMTELEERVGDVDLSHLESALAELNETRLPALEETLAGKAESSDLPALEGRLTEAFGEGLDAAMTRAGEAEDNAKGHADNMPKVLHGTGAPSGTAPDGSIWWQHQGSLQGAVTAQWNRVGGSWVSTPIDSKAIANLDVGKLTAGGAVISDAVIQDLTAANGAFDRLDAREAWIGGVALEDGAVTARTVDVENVFTNEAVVNTLWADRIQARVAELARATVASQNLIPGMSRISEATPPPFKSGFGRNTGHPSIWVRSGTSDHGDNTVTTSGDDDSLIHLEASEVYRFRVGVAASKSGTTAYMALADENGNRVNVTRDGSNSSYLLVNHEAGSTATRPEYYEAEITPPYSGAFRLIFYANHTNGAPNPDSYQWFHGLTLANMLDGRLLVDGTVTTRHLVAEAVKAANIDVEELFANEAVVNTVWAEVVRAGLLTAEEALIGGALLKDGIIDADKINAESVTAAVAQFLEIEAGMIKANAFEGQTFTGGTFRGARFETHTAPERGVKMQSSGLVGYTTDGEAGFELSSETGRAVLASRQGDHRVAISSEGLLVSGPRVPYPDPNMEDEWLTSQRLTDHGMDDGLGGQWHTLFLTDAQGNIVRPSLNSTEVVLTIRVPGPYSADVMINTSTRPDSGGLSRGSRWRVQPGTHKISTNAIKKGLSSYFKSWGTVGTVEFIECYMAPIAGSGEAPLISITGQGFEAWTAGGDPIAYIGDERENFLAGRLYTNTPGAPGAILDEDRGPGSSQGAGLWLSHDGSVGSTEAAIWATKDSSTGEYTTMNIRGPSGGDVRHRSRSSFDDGMKVVDGGLLAFETDDSGYTRFRRRAYFDQFTYMDNNVYIGRELSVTGDSLFRGGATFQENVNFNSRPYFNDWTYHPGAPTSTNSANVRLGGTGYYMLRITSARDAKVNIEDMDVDEDKVLSLRPRTWFDRTETIDRLGNEAVIPTPDGPQSNERAALDAGLQRIPGLVAEEVEELGLEEFVIYEPDEDDHGKRVIESVAYDRIAIALIPSVRRNRERIIALEAENEALHSKVNDLEARLAALEAKLND